MTFAKKPSSAALTLWTALAASALISLFPSTSLAAPGSAQNRKSADYGLTASANFLLPIADRTGFVLGARYLHGLSNNSKNSAYDEKIDDFMLTAGVSFGM